jgi:hypothetical protein
MAARHLLALSQVLVTVSRHRGIRVTERGVLPARELAMIRNRKQLHTAAAVQERLRVRGVVAERGDGYSGTYRNTWLSIELAGASVRVTASPTSSLGMMPVGSTVELACRLTGMVDVATDTYYGERAQLLSWAPPEERRPAV